MHQGSPAGHRAVGAAAAPPLRTFWLECDSRITGTRVVQKREHHATDVGKKATHTVFSIRVDGPDGSAYHVERRYTEFASLHAALSPCRFARPPPPLPKKTVLRFKSKGKSVVEKRISAFQSLLSEASTLSQREQEPLRRFLTDRVGREQDMVAAQHIHPDASVAIASPKQVNQARLVADALQQAKAAAARREADDVIAAAAAAEADAVSRASVEAAAAEAAAVEAAAAAQVAGLQARAAAEEAAAGRAAAAASATAAVAAAEEAAAAAAAATVAQEAEVFVTIHKDDKPTYGLTLCSIGYKTFVNVVKETGAAHGEFARIGLSAQDGLMFKAINGVDVTGGKNAVGRALKASAGGATLTILFARDPAGFEEARLAPMSLSRSASPTRPLSNSASADPGAGQRRHPRPAASSDGAAVWRRSAEQPMPVAVPVAAPSQHTATAPPQAAPFHAANGTAWSAAAQSLEAVSGTPSPTPTTAPLPQSPPPETEVDAAARMQRLQSSPGRKKIQEKRAKLASIKAKRLARQASGSSAISATSPADPPTAVLPTVPTEAAG